MPPQNHGGDNRHHRQHAGCESQADTSPQKEQQIEPERAFIEAADNFVDAVLAFDRRPRRGFTRHHVGGDRQRHGQECSFRWIADALAGAALVTHGEGERERTLATVDRHQPGQWLRVDFGHAEVGVILLHAEWQFACRDFHVCGDQAGGFNGEFVAVEVVPRLNIKADLDPIAGDSGGARLESQIWWQEAVAACGCRKFTGCGDGGHGR